MEHADGVVHAGSNGVANRLATTDRLLLDIFDTIREPLLVLESDGIVPVLRSRIAPSGHPVTVGAQGEVVVMVQPADVVRARGLLLRVVNGPR